MTNLEGNIQRQVAPSYSLRNWIEYGFKQVKDELGWADFRVTNYTRIAHVVGNCHECLSASQSSSQLFQERNYLSFFEGSFGSVCFSVESTRRLGRGENPGLVR